MKFTDRILGLDPERAQPGNPNYDSYRRGVFITKIGGGALAAAAVLDTLGLEFVAGVATIAGVGAISIGGGQVALKTASLTEQNPHQSSLH